MSLRAGGRPFVVVLLVVLLASGCRVRADIGVDVKEDGSGTVTVTIGLDEDALKKAPNFNEALRVDDLTARGWSVTAAVKGTDGFTSVTASKPFANSDEANRIFTELSGPNGPFRDFKLTRKRAFARTTSTFTGTVDFSGGLEAFSDSELAQQLDGQPLGASIEEIERSINDTLDRVFEIRIAVRLPGDVTSNAPESAINGARWQPRLSQPAAITLEAKGTSVRWLSIIGAGVAALSAILLPIVIVVLLLRRRRSASTGVGGLS